MYISSLFVQFPVICPDVSITKTAFGFVIVNFIFGPLKFKIPEDSIVIKEVVNVILF